MKIPRNVHYNFGIQRQACKPFLHFERVNIGKNHFLFIHFFHFWIDFNWHYYD